LDSNLQLFCNHIKRNNKGTNYKKANGYQRLEKLTVVPIGIQRGTFCLIYGCKIHGLSYANTFLWSIFIRVEAVIWKTAQNSNITWFNWCSQFHTTVLLSSAVYTMSLKWAVVPRLSIQQYPGNRGLHPSPWLSSRNHSHASPTTPAWKLSQSAFTTNEYHDQSIAADILADVNIRFKIKSK